MPGPSTTARPTFQSPATLRQFDRITGQDTAGRFDAQMRARDQRGRGGQAGPLNAHTSGANIPGKEARSEYLSDMGAQVSGGGVSQTNYGSGDPNALPQWNPLHPRAGLGSSYLNLMEAPSARAGQTNDALQSRVLGSLTSPHQDRGVPGTGFGPGSPQDQTRGMSIDAAHNVGAVGGDMSRVQRNMTGQALNRGAAGAAEQERLMAQGGSVGAAGAGAQQGLMGMLQAQAAGTAGPSAAQAQLQRGLDQAARQQASVAAGVRGDAAAGAVGQAQRAGADVLTRGAADASMLRAQEQQTAQALLGNVAAQNRAGDVSAFDARGRLAGDVRTAGMNEAATAAGIAGQARGQDIGQAESVAQLLAGQRGMDIGAAQASGALGLEGRALDDAVRQREIANALGLYGAQVGAGAADAGALQGAAGIINNQELGSRGVDAQNRALGNQPPWWAGMAMQGLGAGFGALV